jgi:hypothetical protein
MEVINESAFPERDAKILEAHQDGISAVEIGKQMTLSVSRVRQIIKRAKATETFDLVLHDGTQRVPVAKVTTSRGFIYSCRMIRRKYSGLFTSLELPNWKLSADAHTVAVNSEELAR